MKTPTFRTTLPNWYEEARNTMEGWTIQIVGPSLTEAGRAYALADLIENTPVFSAWPEKSAPRPSIALIPVATRIEANRFTSIAE